MICRARKKNEMNYKAPLTRSSMFIYTSLYSVRALLSKQSDPGQWTVDTTSVYPYYSIKRSELFPLQFLLSASTMRSPV